MVLPASRGRRNRMDRTSGCSHLLNAQYRGHAVSALSASALLLLTEKQMTTKISHIDFSIRPDLGLQYRVYGKPTCNFSIPLPLRSFHNFSSTHLYRS